MFPLWGIFSGDIWKSSPQINAELEATVVGGEVPARKTRLEIVTIVSSDL